MNALFLASWRYWSAGGPILVPIALVCFGIWFVFLVSRRRALAVLREGRDLDRLLGEGLRHGSVSGLAVTLADVPGVAARALRRATVSMQHGTPPAQALDRHMAAEESSLSRNLVVLAALTAVAPLLGLLGTVAGMVDTFEAVSAVSGDTAGRVATGVSRALITTQCGLVVAIPGVFGSARLRRLLRQVHTRFARHRALFLMEMERDRTEVAPCSG